MPEKSFSQHFHDRVPPLTHRAFRAEFLAAEAVDADAAVDPRPFLFHGDRLGRVFVHFVLITVRFIIPARRQRVKDNPVFPADTASAREMEKQPR